jgi:enoyl-CoA hydratase
LPESPHLIVERDGHLLVVTMNRPEARNAFGPEMLVRLADAWTMADGDPDIRVVILTGAGGHFCAGSDLKAMAGGWKDDAWAPRFKEDPDLHWKALLRHYRLKKPLIAAVEGTAVAGGTEILQGTDIRIAGQSAKFGVARSRTRRRWRSC